MTTETAINLTTKEAASLAAHQIAADLEKIAVSAGHHGLEFRADCSAWEAAP